MPDKKNAEKKDVKKIGIIICDRYRTCAGGKCLRAFHNREGAFSIYDGEDVKLAAYATCGGCPGGNIEYAPEEMKKNGVSAIHFATGMIVGYPPCPRIKYFSEFIQEKYGIDVVFGTHPIPEKNYRTHSNLKTWDSKLWEKIIEPVLCDEKTRLSYD